MFDIYKDLKEYKAYFIDIDNTILNYTYAHNKALEIVSQEYGFSYDDYTQAKIKIKRRDLKVNHHKKELYFKLICEAKGWSFVQSLKMYESYRSAFEKHILADRGIVDFLIRAKSDGKSVIAITNFYVIDQIRKLNLAGVGQYIDHLLTSEEYEVEKPNALLIEEALRLSGVRRSEAVMIGDSTADDSGPFGVDYYPYNCAKLLISISGKSGAGKSTITKTLKKVWNCCVIEGDGYHKYERDHPEWANLTHYNPNANNLIQLGLDIKNIFHDMNHVAVPIYNHSNGKFSAPTELKPSDLDVIVVDGLHSLYKEVTGNYIKIKIFIDNELADHQKIERDVTHRNKSIDSVISSIDARKEDYERYISIQKEFSNIIVDVSLDRKVRITIKDDLVFSSILDNCENYYRDDGNNLIILCTYDELNDTMFNIMAHLKENRYV